MEIGIWQSITQDDRIGVMMANNSAAIAVRKKKLAVLIKSARTTVDIDNRDAAASLGVSVDHYAAFENGTRSPSIPELEILAVLFDVPLEYFWGNQSHRTNRLQVQDIDVPHLLGLRRKMIATRLKISRSKAGLSIADLAEDTGLSQEQLEAYESGQQDIEVPYVELLSKSLGSPLEQFFDQQGPVGNWAATKIAADQFMGLPSDLQKFVTQPVNRPYIELAQRLSEIPADKLRVIAEGLLEITL
jgi:transcriptional regulator with XRE-family HTH domain